ncbi:MAG: ComEC/Rec2 family competence protein [Proteobacteria bacterium]|nr:ComEC/Rec2 family competence protein [Pseudomonadota bacterium]
MARLTLRHGLGSVLASEREQWPLWLPVGLLGGIALYFDLAFEPWAWAGALAGAILLTGAVLLRRVPVAGLCLFAAAVVAAGYALAQWETWRVAGPLLSREIGPVPVSGRIVDVEPREKDVRIVLDALSIPWLDAGETPRRVRITVRTHGGIAPVPGESVTILAILRGPPGPAWPGGFDFGRDAWFKGIGGVGFAVGPLTARDDASSPPAGLWADLRDGLERVRLAATRRILDALPGETGGIAAALLTGERGGVPEETLVAVRDAGLAHLLAISGLHLGMVAAIAFFVVRFALAAIEPLALHRPIKTWAALAAIVVSLGYLLISGMTVPTQRAFLMTSVVLFAVMLGRQAISLRMVALAASLILAIAPHVAMGASFQLSFAAVLGLVAVCELLRDRVPGWRAAHSWGGRIALYLAGVALTTMIANAATTPFVLAHFGRIATWGPLANLAAVPLFAIWVMPWGLMALLLMPLGLEGLALVPMGWGIDGILAIARWTSGLPWSHLSLPHASSWALPAAGLGLLWLCLWRKPWRLAGLAGVALAAVLFALARPPDILVNGDADLVALRLPDGALAMSTLRRDALAREAWTRMAGDVDEVAWPQPGEGGLQGAQRCDALGCLYRPPERPDLVVAVIAHPAALDEDCAMADLVLALVPVENPCPAPLGVIDRFDLWRQGGHAITFTGKGATIDTLASERGERPWSQGPQSQ